MHVRMKYQRKREILCNHSINCCYRRKNNDNSSSIGGEAVVARTFQQSKTFDLAIEGI